MRDSSSNRNSSQFKGVFAGCASAFVGIGLMSAVVNVLYLTGSLFMMEVYDRVLPSRSLPTLVALLAIVVVLYAFQGLFDALRGRLLVRIADRLDQALSPRIYDAIVGLQLQVPISGRYAQPLRDLDTIRAFLSGSGPTALFDLPWLPFYIAICFAFHFWLGVTALAGAVILAAITLLTELVSQRPVEEAARHSSKRNRMAESGRRNADVITVMGMGPHLRRRWQDENRAFTREQRRASDVSSGFGVLSKVLRMMLQSGILAVGAWLVINEQATPGIIIAGSILSARALAPVDLAIANWKGFIGARQSRRRLQKTLALLPDAPDRMDLPAPSRALSVERVSALPPETTDVVLQDVTFTLEAGAGLGVIGASGSGKSSLARLLVGIWHPARGAIRLDGATPDQWPAAALARHIGYMPQSIELLDGTIAENIASFDPDAGSDDIIAAARAARVHDLIVSLPEGYSTEVGENGRPLSAGQKQRIALARALYRDPFVVILDEPNSNLDSEGEEALTSAILGIRERGGIVIVIAHRPSALLAVDKVLMLAAGRQQAFGPKDEVLSKVLRQTTANPGALKVVQSAEAAKA
ncbi:MULTISPECIES: type I secretion system permease/ATPase [unclassified Ensifer]|uniref:type I secretion system permease/ATPase n=1 Tax=unclassified Ensifer TaxID=2633371 RepID=UPI00070C0B2E|nr:MULTISPECIES: type I secretion system permease/ATPase [unclassified Ensifer]KQW60652.1 type I secretion protein [Ensifer sp. Root1252]KQW73892.1 type I secretion protein [Ensifer sp. Root127]KRC79481.1 type I secretion protein [Ensifer sp. Root231]KRC99873.1 type I secretion protein [Ensifer sp. Root258]